MGADNWHLNPLRAPTLADGDELIYDEPGRVLPAANGDTIRAGTDCRSHWFRIVRNVGAYALLVHHGAGEERINLGGGYRQQAQFLAPLESDARYRLMWTLLDVHKQAERAATDATAMRYKQAFADGTLKKRKQRNSHAVKVWIENRF